MRKLSLWIVLLLVCGLALPAAAQEDEGTDWDDPEAWDEWEEGDGGGGFGDYAETAGNRYLIGLNSVLTWPADFVMSTAQPRDEFNELPGAAVTKYPVGLVQGSLLAVYRLSTGILDLVFAPLTPMKMLSPEPRYLLFESAEHEWY